MAQVRLWRTLVDFQLAGWKAHSYFSLFMLPFLYICKQQQASLPLLSLTATVALARLRGAAFFLRPAPWRL